ncbi:very low-density lipoprotein receptor-like [Xenia sp. Carnegie-2017]|uniref:very low-density lipoprotein receptor-like n=1 Tax=Xenia sp. Carnegie-2017 TaxID=2897299 RepID=UPI001F04B460|nr:very low-density lipoprotein receptor-like [Xenia sp. Carnegie-2017]XP_046862113.1 very low-density lipoprotein receptor-like [Xenia sp. Carnegie-2017]
MQVTNRKCVSLRCGRRRAVTVPFSYNYLCCRGSLYNQMKYVCVRYNYGSRSRIVLEHCNPCRQFKCENGECTKKQWKCNNIKDCADGSDEVGCPKCRRSKYLFACRKGRKCILKAECVTRSTIVQMDLMKLVVQLHLETNVDHINIVARITSALIGD